MTAMTTVSRLSAASAASEELTDKAMVNNGAIVDEKNTDTTETSKVSFKQPDNQLQLPLLSDLEQTDKTFDEKLDFSVRLGASIARDEIARDEHVDLTIGNAIRLSENNKTKSSTSSFDGAFEKEQVTRRSKKIEEVVVQPIIHWRHGSNKGTAMLLEQTKTSSNWTNGHEPPLKKLRRVFRSIRLITGVCLELKRYIKTCDTQSWSFMEMYLHVKADLNKVVAFDPQSFAKIEPGRLRLKKILRVPSSRRTNEHLKVILALLRDNKSFQDYPYHIQIRLAQYMEYQSYETRRVILRHGHRPEAFYILLSGYVMVNVQDINVRTGKIFAKTVKEMGPGETFGEVALIEGGRRTATIVCKTDVELLVILKDDFDSIIREPLVKQMHEHVEFCKSMALFQDFPCHQLREFPSQFFYHYFKKGDIVVKDSKESKYIIIVKAGKCRVISSYTDTLTPTMTKDQQDSSYSLNLNMAFPHFKELEKLRVSNQKCDDDKQKEAICLGLLTGRIEKTRLADHGPEAQRPKTSIVSSNEFKSKSTLTLKKCKSCSNFLDAVNDSRNDQLVTLAASACRECRGYLEPRRINSIRNILSINAVKTLKTGNCIIRDMNTKFWSTRFQYKLKEQRDDSANSKRSLNYQRRKCSSATSRSGKRSRHSENPFYETEKQTFVQIAELTTGMVFGLEGLVQTPTTTISLISEGAECIFISKRLFLDLAGIKVLKVLTDTIKTYPSREAIKEQVKTSRNWQKFKSRLVQNVLDRNK